MGQAAQPSELERELDAENLGFLRAVNQRGADFDVGQLPGMGPHLGLFEAASRRRDEDRQGTGLMRMGQHGSNPNFVALLREQQDARRRQEAGGQLERAYALRNAEVRGSMLPLMSLGQSRRLTLASLGSSDANAAQGYANQSQNMANQTALSSGFFNSNLFNQIMAGAQAAAGMPRFNR